MTDLRTFPLSARREAGYQLFRVQHGEDPSDWKPLRTVGPGVREIRIQDEGQYRIIYVANMANAVHVLHAFGKKSRRTLKRDIEIARRRLKQIRDKE